MKIFRSKLRVFNATAYLCIAKNVHTIRTLQLSKHVMTNLVASISEVYIQYVCVNSDIFLGEYVDMFKINIIDLYGYYKNIINYNESILSVMYKYKLHNIIIKL